MPPDQRPDSDREVTTDISSQFECTLLVILASVSKSLVTVNVTGPGADAFVWLTFSRPRSCTLYFTLCRIKCVEVSILMGIVVVGSNVAAHAVCVAVARGFTPVLRMLPPFLVSMLCCW